MKILRYAFGIAFISTMFGFVLPWLISAKCSVLVLLGLCGVFIITPCVLWMLFEKEINILMGKEKTK